MILSEIKIRTYLFVGFIMADTIRKPFSRMAKYT